MISSRIISKGIENSPSSCMITTPDGKIVYVNKKCISISGYSFDEFIGKNPKMLKSGQHGSDLYSNLWATISSGKEWTGRFINKKKSGEEYIESVSIFPIFREKTSHIEYYMAMKKDITEQVYAEDRLKIRETELLELNSNKDKLFSIISHDLRGPFLGLLGYTTILNEEFDLLERTEMKTIIENLQTVTENVYELLDNLLYWARVQQHTIKFDPIPINLHEFVSDIIRLNIPTAKKNKIELINRIDLNVVIEADENMLNSIYNNLISNALKFTPSGGYVKVSTINISNTHVTCNIQDSGIGISQENIDKILKLGESFTIKGINKEIGSGLGLILIKEFLRNHNSELKIKSSVNVGTEFSFDLKLF
jgi:PAS domain S-box-containing protein